MKQILYIDDNKSNLKLMESVMENMSSTIGFQGVDSVKDFISQWGGEETLYIIDYNLREMKGHDLYGKLLQFDREAKALIVSAGYIGDLKETFKDYPVQPLAITDRFGLIEKLEEVISLWIMI